jgi:hypothetical protein
MIKVENSKTRVDRHCIVVITLVIYYSHPCHHILFVCPIRCHGIDAGDSNPHLKGAVVGVQAALAAVDADVAAPVPPTSRYAACQRRTYHQNRDTKELEVKFERER